MKLREWQYMNKPAGSTTNNSSTSSGYKKRFEKLIKYHIDHASSELESVTKKVISDWHFLLAEHYNTGFREFDREVALSVDKTTGTFHLDICVDGKQVYYNDYKSYEDVLETLTGSYMFLPDEGTSEYRDILVEWIDTNGNKINLGNSSAPSQPTTKAPYKTNKEKFIALTQYMQDHKDSFATKTQVIHLDDGGFSYKELRTPDKYTNVKEYTIKADVAYSRFSSAWSLKVYKNDVDLLDSFSGTGWEDLLYYLSIHFDVPEPGCSEYKSLTESASSIADDFRLYENLWENI
jgi:hypothetical protein